MKVKIVPLNSALDANGCLTPGSGRFNPGKEIPHPLCAPGPVWTDVENTYKVRKSQYSYTKYQIPHIVETRKLWRNVGCYSEKQEYKLIQTRLGNKLWRILSTHCKFTPPPLLFQCHSPLYQFHCIDVHESTRNEYFVLILWYSCIWHGVVPKARAATISRTLPPSHTGQQHGLPSLHTPQIL